MIRQLLQFCPDMAIVTLYKTVVNVDKCVCYRVLILNRTVHTTLICKLECESLIVTPIFRLCALPVYNKLLRVCSVHVCMGT